ncbi:MAG: IclR family transcriptional regulator [Bacillota bacterium]|jgi:DNA-binding IclR family transcriptional regulator
MSSFDKMIKVLNTLGRQSGGIGIIQLSKQINMPQSTTHRLLAELMKYNLVIQESGSRHYTIGPGLLNLGLAYIRQNPINAIAQPFLVECCSILKETVFLTVLANQEAICTSTVMAEDRNLNFFMGTGKRMPLHASAAAWAILAYFGEERVRQILKKEEFVPFSSTTPRTIDDVLTYLHKTRENGYSICNGEMDVGVTAISVPICNFSGQVVASLTAVGSEYRLFPVKERENVIRVLKKYAENISLSIGCPVGEASISKSDSF